MIETISPCRYPHTAATMAAGPYNYSYIFKYIIIGDMGVGKSCLLHQFTEKKCMSFIVVLTFHDNVLVSS